MLRGLCLRSHVESPQLAVNSIVAARSESRKAFYLSVRQPAMTGKVWKFMRARALMVSATILYFAVVAFSQDPLTTLPKTYKLQFENDWVKIVRAHYGPHEKIPAHDHSRLPVAYVYLNNAGPVIFKHVGGDNPALTRPATTTGSYRLSPTTFIDETHEVENTADVPSEFLRVEFKTYTVDRDSMIGRHNRGEYPSGKNHQKVEFENGQMRITRLICAPRQNLDVEIISPNPALFIALSDANFRLIAGKVEAKQTILALGQTIWMTAAGIARFENMSDGPLEFLKFDLKTTPMDPREKPKRKGEYRKSIDN
jgi:hypothetical protein